MPKTSKNPLRKYLRRFFYLVVLFFLLVTATVFFSGDSEYAGMLNESVVNDITELNPIHVAREVKPRTIADIQEAILSSKGPVSIGGGRFSMGGQTALQDSLHLDMREYNQVLGLDEERREVTVQSGITWHQLQEYIDPHNLSVKIMQTYANFTVGGSMSVNVHGRYIGHGPMISSIRSFSIVLADGSVQRASPEENPEIYYAAIGGYGGIGVIAEVTLALEENARVERRTEVMPLAQYGKYFFDNIRNNDKVVFQNGDLYPPDYDTVRDVSWYVTDKPLTIDERLIPADREYTVLPFLVGVVNDMPFGKGLRRNIIDPLYYIPDRVVWRNWEASYDVRELGGGDRSDETYVLQEYFIPVGRLEHFVPKMREVFQHHDVNVLNVSIRHAFPDKGSYLAWAREEVFAFVVYYSQGTSAEDMRAVGIWTREMIDAILAEGGSYYLPYQPHASSEQFHRAYPYADKYFAVKQRLDPGNRFQNRLWEKYYPSEAQRIREHLDTAKNYYKGEEQSYLSLPEWYLVYNPNEYSRFLDRGNNPSDFPFLSSIDEYWTLYDRVNTLTRGVYPDNGEYQTMLWVIGVSTTAEYLVKGAYENTIGRFARWTASAETREEEIIRDAHRAYAKLIYDQAWYEFPFMDWVGKIWSDSRFFGRNFIRKLERKLAFSLEFGFKALYAKLIGFGAQTAYEASDGRVIAVVELETPEAATTMDSRIEVLQAPSAERYVVSLPRWGGFSELVPKLVAAGAQFREISGNDDILITVLADGGTSPQLEQARYLFSSRVFSPEGRRRLAFSVKVRQLHRALLDLKNRGMQLEHIYDY